MGKVPVRHLLRLWINQLPRQTDACTVGAPASVNDVLEVLEGDFGLRPFPRFLTPALFSDLPDSRGHSWGFKTARFWWPFTLKNQNGDFWIRPPWEGDLSRRELETKTIRTRTDHAFGKRARLHDDHRQRVHVRPVRRFLLLNTYGVSDIEEFGGTVPHREAVVGCRGVN